MIKIKEHIGIGTPIAERPSHTTGRTLRLVSGGSAGQNKHKRTKGLNLGVTFFICS